MERFKSIYRVARAAAPILYCGYLLYYFFDVGGSIDGVRDVGLGPTVIGLGAVALLFSIPFLLKVVRLFNGPRSGGGAPTNDGDDDDGGAAADAIIARYMARQAAEAAATGAPAPKMSGPAKPSFGKKR